MINELENVSSYIEDENSIIIELFDFSSLFTNIKILEKFGYEFVGDNGNFEFIMSGKKKVTFKVLGGQNYEIKMPNYDNCMVNIASSFINFYGGKSQYKTLEKLDTYLKNKFKHLAFIILDGLAVYAIENILDKHNFLRKNMVDKISAVFPPTTACAIPCSASGKLSLETGWIGWENYFDDINLDLVMFNGIDYKTGKRTGINVRQKYIPYEDYFQKFDTFVSDLEPSFLPNGFETFGLMLETLNQIQNAKEKSFTYAYWTEPDATMHQFGTDAAETKRVIIDLNDKLEDFINKMNKDSLLVITADHGHLNVNKIKLYEFEDIMECLERTPSNESRALCFKVKENKKEQFVKLFNKYFKSIYDLYSKEEFLEKGFLGDVNEFGKHPILDMFIGDYIAVAKSNYYFEYVKMEEEFTFKSHHAGLTKEEMEVPLIIYHK